MPLFSQQLMMRKRENSIKSFFEVFLLKFKENIYEIHKQWWLPITWIPRTLNSIQTLLEDILEIPDLSGLFWVKPIEFPIQ